MASTDEKEESFVLKKDQCWVVSDNKKLKPKGINSLATAYIYIDISITFMLTFDGSLCTPVTIWNNVTVFMLEYKFYIKIWFNQAMDSY